MYMNVYHVHIDWACISEKETQASIQPMKLFVVFVVPNFVVNVQDPSWEYDEAEAAPIRSCSAGNLELIFLKFVVIAIDFLEILLMS